MQTLPSLSWSQSFKLAIQNYAKFNGRARRSEFFYFYLTISAITYILFIVLFQISDSYYDEYDDEYHYDIDREGEIILWIIIILRIMTFLPLLGLTIRRLHDIGRSGCFVLFDLIPFLGPIILICLCCIDSERTENIYGPSPKYVMPSGNLFPENNYVPPYNVYTQPNHVIVPVNPNQQQNPVSPVGIPYPQEGQYLYQETPNLPQNPIPSESMNAPQPYNNILPSSDTPYSNYNSQQPFEGDAYDPYSKPNPNQPSSDIYYNSSTL